MSLGRLTEVTKDDSEVQRTAEFCRDAASSYPDDRGHRQSLVGVEGPHRPRNRRKSGSHWTLRWSKPDSKSRSRRERNGRGADAVAIAVTREDLSLILDPATGSATSTAIMAKNERRSAFSNFDTRWGSVRALVGDVVRRARYLHPLGVIPASCSSTAHTAPVSWSPRPCATPAW